ncbi:HNH endonuclease signature motif containing protein [Rosistilla oblonga]|uniref:HNH endonuclease n=1 Tax=Rosistilla oblonga TaxID=2527990 RepID=UPI0011A49DC6
MPKRARRLGERRPDRSPAAPRPITSRKTSTQRGYDRRWRKERRAFLAENPYCAEHLRRKQIRLAQCVDHIIPHRGNKRLFWSRRNWQSLCNSCHSKKTQTERTGIPNNDSRHESTTVTPGRGYRPQANDR